MDNSPFIVCIGVSSLPLPSKTPSLFLAKSLLKLTNCPSPPFSTITPPPSLLYWFFVNPPIKVRFFSEPQKYSSFSSLTPSYLLKVAKFLVKISQFEFLVMIEKNIFAYKLFLSLNISDFNLFLMWKLQPPEKSHPPLSQQNPSKSWSPVKLPLFENLVGGSTPPLSRRVHTMPLNSFFIIQNSIGFKYWI